jgi:nicotinate-nucleotide adenylyltransferase
VTRRGPLGILGGTFDPIHRGHLQLAELACARLHLAAVTFVPSGRPPHRQSTQASPEQRLEMVRLAVARHAAFDVDAREVHRAGTSYTIDTLRELRAEHGAARSLVLLLGADAFALLDTWRQWRHIVEVAHIAVFGRSMTEGASPPVRAPSPALAALVAAHAGSGADAIAGAPAGSIVHVADTVATVSATEVRARLRAGRSVDALLPPEVTAYICAHGLYGTGAPGPCR